MTYTGRVTASAPRLALVGLLGLSAGPAAALAGLGVARADPPPEPFAGGAARQAPRMPVRDVDRPLTLPHRLYGVDGLAAVTQIADGLTWVQLGASAGYGINDKLEVGIALLDVSLSRSPESGLQLPEVWVRYRGATGPVEVAAEARSELPIAGELTLGAGVFARAHVPRWLRFDLGVRGQVELRSDPRPLVAAPASLTVQLADPVAIELGAEAAIVDFARSRVTLRPRARVGWTIVDEDGPFVDVGVDVQTASIMLHGTRPPDPYLANHWSALVMARFFVFQRPSWEDDPLDF